MATDEIPLYPVLGVSAAIFRGEQVLLVQRGGDGGYAGRWSLPGGKLEPSERLAEGVRREVMEETGLTIEPAGVADIVEVVDSGQPEAAHFVIVVFAATSTQGSPIAGDDAVDVCWLSPERLGDVEVTPGLADTIERARQFLFDTAARN